MKAKQNDSDALDAAMRGTRAVLDYSGLLAWSILSRSGCAIKKKYVKDRETYRPQHGGPLYRNQ